jgi:hypothetical protein
MGDSGKNNLTSQFALGEDGARKRESLLTDMDVVYSDAARIFFDDDGPLYPSLSKSVPENTKILDKKVLFSSVDSKERDRQGVRRVRASELSISGVVPVIKKTHGSLSRYPSQRHNLSEMSSRNKDTKSLV